jgi:hypothetical protein
MIRRIALAVLALSAFGCGKQTFLAAVFVQTPALPNPVDASQSIPQFQVLTAFFGTIDTSSPTKIDASKLAPITDAKASIAFRHIGTSSTDVTEDRILTVPAASNPAGTYALSSKDEPRLTFEVGQPYTMVLQTAGADGEVFGARFVPAEPTDIVEFRNSTCTVTVGVGSTTAKRCMDGVVSQPLTITRTDVAPAGGDLPPAFPLVGRIDPNNPSAAPQITYNPFDSAGKLLKYYLSDVPYRTQTFLIPATAFAQQGYYVVTLLIVKQGKVSANTFLGSTALACSGAAGILHVQ